MTLYTREDEKACASKRISAELTSNQENLEQATIQLKQAKKNIRKLTKQLACNHEFKLKQTLSMDEYACKKCKFKFKYSAYLEKNGN